MLGYVYGHDQAVAQFVAQLIPHCRRGFGPNITAIGVVEDGRLIAGLVYSNYDPEAATIEISGAALPGKYWLTRGTLARMFEYPFLCCGCQMIYQKTPIDSERLLGVLAKYGYSFIKIPRMFGRDQDGVLCVLTYEDWCASKFNRRRQLSLIEEAA
jgi:RimJ/RimL family protein N-acetyltransferase